MGSLVDFKVPNVNIFYKDDNMKDKGGASPAGI